MLLTAACASDTGEPRAGLAKNGHDAQEVAGGGTTAEGAGRADRGRAASDTGLFVAPTTKDDAAAAADAVSRDSAIAAHEAVVGSADAALSTNSAGPAVVSLGAAADYVILAKAAITNVPTSVVTGNIGLSPAAASYIAGFPLTRAGTQWNAPEIVGSAFAADNDPPTPINLTSAIGSMETAYVDAAGRPTPTSLNLGAGTIGSLTLAPGLYKWTSAVTIPTDLVLAGTANDTWIFQISGDLSIGAAKRVTLRGGAQAKNIVWQVAGAVNLGTTSHFEGVVLSKTAVTVQTGASINGRLFAQTAVSIAGATVTAPAR